MGYTFTITQTLTPVITIEENATPTITVTDQNNTFTVVPPAAVTVAVTGTSYRFTATTDITQIRTENLATSFRGDWSATGGYQRGDTVRYGAAVYVCTVASGQLIIGNPSNPAPNGDSRWTIIFGTEDLNLTAGQITALARAEHMLPWSSATTYSLYDWTWSTATDQVYILTDVAGSLNHNPDTQQQYWTPVGGLTAGVSTYFDDLEVRGQLQVGGLNFPTTQGYLGQVLTTNGENQAVWATPLYRTSATNTTLGVVRIGSGLSVTNTGTISVNPTQADNINLNNHYIYNGTASSNLGINYYSSYGATKPWLDLNDMGLHLKVDANPTYNVTEGLITIENQGERFLAIDAFGHWVTDIKVGVVGNPYSQNANIHFYGTNSGVILGTSTNYIQFGDGSRQYSAAQDISIVTATNTRLGGVKIGAGINVTQDGTISVTTASFALSTATNTRLGGVRIGSGIQISANGTISVNTGSTYVLVTATNTRLGGVRIGSGINLSGNGTISVEPYTLPTASNSSLGGIKVGSGLNIVDGVVSTDLNLYGDLNLNTYKIGDTTGLSILSRSTSTTIAHPQQINLQGPVVVLGQQYDSHIHVDNLYARDGASPPMVPVGIMFPDLTVQTTAFTTASGAYTLPTASTSTLGGVKIGQSFTTTGTGFLTLNTATSTRLGGIKVATSNALTMDPDGTLHFIYPKATANDLGMIRVGDGLSVDVNGIVSVTGGGSGGTTGGKASFYWGTFTGTGITSVSGQVRIDGTGIWFPDGTKQTSAYSGDRFTFDINETILTGGFTADTLTINNTGTLVFADGTVQETAATPLTTATNTTLGGIKIGSGLSIDSTGTVSVVGGSAFDFGTITQPLATTVDFGAIV